MEPSPPSSEPPLKFTGLWPLSLPREPDRADASPGAASGKRVLVAEDDPISRELLVTRLTKWGYEPVVTTNGTDAMAELRHKDAPCLALLDWMMPGMDGIEVCRRAREANFLVYIILLTARGGKESIIEGLRAGADDYLVKPFDKDELQARILVGLRVVTLHSALTERVQQLEEASAEIASLRMQLPL